MSKVIIFGASGFLGKELVKKSDSFDWNVLYPDSKTVNLCDYDLVNNYLARNASKSSTVIMIANHMPYASLSKDSFELMFDNVLMVKNLLLALKHNPVSEVIFASSIDVYGSNDSIINEKTFLDPLTNYATSKAACELLLKTRLTQLSIPFLNFRLPQIIGKDDPSSKVVNKFLDAAVNKTSIIMKGDGSSSRDFASVSDVAEIILRSVGQKINTTINLVSGNPITVKELAELVQSLCPEIDILFKNNSSNESRFNFNNAKFDQYFPDFVFENRADLIEKLYDYKLKK